MVPSPPFSTMHHHHMAPSPPFSTMHHHHHHHHLLLFLLLLTTITTTTSRSDSTILLPKRRSLLHHPLFPVPTTPILPKYPFTTDPPPFFPFHTSTASKPPPPPFEVSEPILPSSIPSSPPPPSPPPPSPPPIHQTHKKFLLAIALPLSSLLLILLSVFLLHRHRRRHRRRSDLENQRILPSSPPPDHSTTTIATHFLHLGTNPIPADSSPGAVGSPYQKLSSPELHPLPPLQRFGGSHREGETQRPAYDSDEDYYYSTGGDGSPFSGALLGKQGSSSRRLFGASILGKCRSNRCLRSFPSTDSPLRSPLGSSSPGDLSDNVDLHPPPPPPLPSKQMGTSTTMPPPPPPPPVGFWEQKIQSEKANGGGVKNVGVPVFPVETSVEDVPRPKLKPLHWDKVRTSSDRAMVWDQLKSSSFRLNEEMIETLFGCNAATTKEKAGWQLARSPTREDRVLDQKKAQNIAILLRALDVTKEEVSEALLEGSMENMSTELLETLLKMAPSREEEIKLREHKEDSPCKLGPAEKFLKAVIDVPFAFKRVEAMLYICNFDSEISYLANSFGTLEHACEELRSSRMFLKLLEAVLKTGNRMNVGTNRGDARAFKLDTLLKLVDVKGTDGKTTLLHFVVQEITKAEGSRLATANLSLPHNHDECELKRIGLQVVHGLCGELGSVKKAAAMDSDVLGKYVSKLASGLGKINEVIRLNGLLDPHEKSPKFHEAMCLFSKSAEDQITKIQVQERVALSLVKEITEYFHGNSTKEEAHPFRIFMVVRDFLSILNRVCKEVGEMNDRFTVGSGARNFPIPVNPTLPPLFPRFHDNGVVGSSGEDDSSASSS